MPNHIFGFWGKSRISDLGKLERHPLAFHMLDVAACAEQILAARPRQLQQIASRSGIDCRGLAATVIRLAALHDIGKCARGFQAKVPALWPDAFGPCSEALDVPPVRHDEAGLWLLTGERNPLRKLACELLPGLGASARKKILQAVCGHHGEPVNTGHIGERDPRIGSKAAENALDLCRALLSVLPAGAPPKIPESAIAPLSFALAGLTILADWLGSNTRWFRFQEPSGRHETVEAELAEYWASARRQAKLAMMQAGLSPAESAPFAGLKNLFPLPDISQLTPLQARAESLSLPAKAPKLILFEDMTGAGKTEAAVTLAHRLIANGESHGVYIALPTMATANAMFERLAKSYRNMFCPEASPSIMLVHGKRRLVEGFATLPCEIAVGEGVKESYSEEDPSQISASAFCADWIARSNKQAFLAQVGAGTIDQALLSVLPARHQALRLWGLADKVLIIDEAHAYDAYMGREIETLLRFHAEFGGSAIVLSATLPRAKRAALINAFQQGLGGAQASFKSKTSAYPLVTIAFVGGVEEIPSALRDGLSRQVRVVRAGSVEEAHAAVLNAARGGAAVALIRNTVDEALVSHEALAREFNGEKLLFHARFAMCDRLTIEDAVLEKFGKRSQRRAGILVATQVIEQSLDLDFDFIVTDLAPIDLLIQRAGRLWRHMDVRPAPTRPRAEPEMMVISAEPADDAGPGWLDAVLPKTKIVYGEDAALLWRSAKVLFDAGQIVSKTRGENEGDSPGEIRSLIEAVYGEEKFAIPDALKTAENRARGKESADRSQARYNVLEFNEGYDLCGGRWESDARIPTRLGDETTTLRLAVTAGGRLHPWAARDAELKNARRGWALSEVSVRKSRCAGVPKPLAGIGALLAEAQRHWTVSEREIPVLILSPDRENPEVWRGTVVDGRGRETCVTYSNRCGLTF
ncbi:MAG TPA: CRISPR-associated helicase Cas3' [Candidatus Acidoferrum sp.]|jgi:CRISPR-associated endonuclease/helicase Cas3|nr:CRISPR-associated helicase Cas3' [Candidatus Acidoferrum sp.]